MIIVSITGPRMKQALAQVAASSRFADAFEFRLDMIQDAPMSLLFSSTLKPIVATCRPTWEGGGFEGREDERLEILLAACEAGVDFVDVELEASKEFLNRIRAEYPGTACIVSHHRFDTKALNVGALYQRMGRTRADVFKLAYAASDACDIRFAVDFLNRAANEGQRAIAIAMGSAGEPSRVLYKRFGGWATFAGTEDGATSASGQIPASVLKKLYRADKLNRRTKIFGVVGKPVAQSKGITMHNPLFQRAQMNAVYCRFEVGNAKLFMETVARSLSGFSVTIPHKQTMMKLVHRTDSTARRIGALNTVVRRRGGWFGTNTDAPGALDAIERRTRVRGKHMLVIGAGGAARAIIYEAKRREANVFVANRSETKARRLSKELGVMFVQNAKLGTLRFDIIANATSIGMMPNVDCSPLPKSMLKKCIVFDAVFNPPMTKLLLDAKSVGAGIVQGTEMYINQAVLQSQLYTGKRPRPAALRKILNTS